MEKVLGEKKVHGNGGIIIAEELIATECVVLSSSGLCTHAGHLWTLERRGGREYALHVMEAGHTFPVAGTKPSNQSHVALALLRLEKKSLPFWGTSHQAYCFLDTFGGTSPVL